MTLTDSVITRMWWVEGRKQEEEQEGGEYIRREGGKRDVN